MQSDWPIVALSDVLETIIDYRGKTPPKSKDGIAVLTAASVKDGRVLKDKVSYISQETYEKVTTRGFPKKGDVLITTEAPVGEVAPFPVDKTYHITRRIMALRGQCDVIDSDFLLYALLGPNNQSQLKACIRGSTVPRVLKTDITGLKFPLPPLFIQKQIGRFLASVDEKIHLNNQTNQTLEQMAQAIFKSWFVDFNPVKAKINGELPEGMDAATASLFPEKLVESELGLIPDGWNAVQVGDIVQRLKPKKRYTKKQVEPYGKTPVYEQGASILLGFHNDDAGFEASPEAPVFIFGDHTCITHLSCSKFDISSNVIPLQGSVRPTIWTYYAIQGKQEFQEYRRHWSEFIIKDVVLPPVELAEKYAELVTTKYLMMESLKRQSKELEQLRDTLLPKLLSGEIELDKVLDV
ncbi:restriction endonuclease subunit S [Photobacterium phosphoreum]|uniref:restriction endonuclease subunit S n=1 Tax=Photobacterium phosphoreum TaxID=659 RepID=UPI0039AF5782